MKGFFCFKIMAVLERAEARRFQLPEAEPYAIPHYAVAVVGAGPQGLAMANELGKQDIPFALIGKPKSRFSSTPVFGGELGTYDIPANSRGRELLLDISDKDPLARAQQGKAAKVLAEMDTPPNLKKRAGKYFRAVGRELLRQNRNNIYAAEVDHTVWDGEKHTVFDDAGNALMTADFVSFNIGAKERSLADVSPERFSRYADKIKSSLDLMKGKTRSSIKEELKEMDAGDRFVVIVGSSHTALTDAAILTKGRVKIGKYDNSNSRMVRLLENLLPKTAGDYIPDGRLIIATHGDPADIKVYADSAEAAVAEGLEQGPPEAVSKEKLCPVTGKYRRFIGFREWAKETYMRWKEGNEPRIDIQPIDEISDEVLNSAIIVQAVGLQSRDWEVQDLTGAPYRLPKQQGVIYAAPDGEIPGIPNTYGGGVGVNVLRPDVQLPGEEKLGGEPEFSNVDGTTRHLHFVAGYNTVARRTARAIYDRRNRAT